MNFGTNSLNLWKFHIDFTTPANSTFTGPTNIPVAAFTTACGGGSCIPQPGTNNKLDSLADRLMYRLAYRHFADGHETLVVNHSVKVSGSKRSEVDGVRWYEILSPGGTPTVFQQGIYAPNDGTSRWMGSIAMDQHGNMALGYSESSGSVFPSVRYTGRGHGCAGHDGHRVHDQGRRRRPDRHAAPLGRLQRHDRGPGGRLHLVIHERVPEGQRLVQLVDTDRVIQNRHLHIIGAPPGGAPAGGFDTARLLAFAAVS